MSQQTVKQTTLAYVFNPQGQVLLAAKKKTNSWFTASLGKRNGPGGKLDEWESYIQGAKRELEEEVGVSIDESRFVHMGILHFDWATKKERDQECHIYVVKDYTGGFQETEEMKPQRFDITALPYENMRPDDAIWLPRVLNGEHIEYIFYHSDNGDILRYEKVQ
jgi:8-oxo-dGTP pyrophosphatase MutT (NUDIX family)